MIEQPPVPDEPRWLVWTDGSAQRGIRARDPLSVARWFWSASGPRGHASGAEGLAEEAINRAMYAAAQLDSPRRPKP